ncbi:methylase involved in ubiquinone/menaquinone biosynthesis [Gloeocapsa sp. PCC 73106]|nr:methylase involved in ubiquinone/menaquinone biosynthesis [Gloeocapsa sp. PCC 73106]
MNKIFNSDYIHGYTTAEQDRLIRQADYWKEKLILRNLEFNEEKHLLEIGCGVGAVLGILGTTFPNLQLSGIDLQPKQIECASRHLEQLGLLNTNLKVGNIQQLPWDKNQFDYVYGIWILEHIQDPIEPLQEAYRVLKPGGKIILNETDLMTLLLYPHSPDYQYLQQALWDLLAQHGNPYIARRFGALLEKTGFEYVTNTPWAFHFRKQELRKFIDYVDEWLTPTLPQMIEQLGKDSFRLETGLDFFRNLPNHPEASATLVVYRAEGRKL